MRALIIAATCALLATNPMEQVSAAEPARKGNPSSKPTKPSPILELRGLRLGMPREEALKVIGAFDCKESPISPDQLSCIIRGLREGDLDLFLRVRKADDTLLYITLSVDSYSGDGGALLDALVEKYGTPPKSDKTIAQNSFGATWPVIVAAWEQASAFLLVNLGGSRPKSVSLQLVDKAYALEAEKSTKAKAAKQI